MMKSVVVLAMALAVSIPALAQDSGWIGISIVDRPEGGVLVRSVETNSPAERAGLRSNDVVVRFNGQEVIGVLQLTRLVNETPVGRSVDITVRRDNREQTLKVTTEAARSGNIRIRTPDLAVLRDRVVQNMPRINIHTSVSSVQNGVRVDEMTPQLREYFGVKQAQGVLVTSVDANSTAAKAGLQAGDVVIAVNGTTVATTSEFARESRSPTSSYRVVRDKKEMDLKVAP
jgi:serine protease Do